MKKGKIIGKGQIAVGVMVVALIGAIWLNTKYMPSSTKYLGEASYVGSTSDNAVQTSAKVEDYFTSAKTERQKTLNTAIETVEELLKTENLNDDEKEIVIAKIEDITANMENEANIEALLKAKGFTEAVAVIGQDGINIIVKSDGLTTANTLQIQDIVTEESGFDLSKIKIIPVK